jgi:hypothetical protein
MSIAKFVLVLPLSISLLGCSKPKATSTPNEAIRNLVQALDDRDSSLFLENLSSTMRQRFAKNDALRHTFEKTEGTNFSYDLIKADTDGTVANVSFWIQGKGKMSVPKTRVDAQFYKEDNSWKFGVIQMINGQPWK